MASSLDFSKASWRLKMDRAEQHLKDFEMEVIRYANRHAYGVERVRARKKYGGSWQYVLRITKQPDPMLADDSASAEPAPADAEGDAAPSEDSFDEPVPDDVEA